MNLCIMSTANDLYMAGENHRCENPAFYPVPGELSQYLLGARVCKHHLKYLLVHGREWAETFRSAGIKKGQNITQLQELYRKQSVMSELS